MDTIINELLPKNIILAALTIGCKNYNTMIIPISEMHPEGIGISVPYNDSQTWESDSIPQEFIQGVPFPFAEKILKDMKVDMEQLKLIPPHIQFLHELQNWYYFNTGKVLIDWENFDDKDGDYWIDITKEFYESEIGKDFIENSKGIMNA